MMNNQAVQKNGGLKLLLWILVMLLSVGGVLEYQRRQERAKQQHVEDLRRQVADKAALERELARKANIERLERQKQPPSAEEQAKNRAYRRESEIRWLARSIEPLEAQANRFVDALQLAAATPRVALAVPVANLQAIARETEAMTVDNSCMRAPKQNLVAGMREIVQGFLAFMRDENKDAYVARAQRLMELWKAGTEACMKAAMETR